LFSLPLALSFSLVATHPSAEPLVQPRPPRRFASALPRARARELVRALYARRDYTRRITYDEKTFIVIGK
jgi:hypothetical protein